MFLVIPAVVKCQPASHINSSNNKQKLQSERERVRENEEKKIIRGTGCCFTRAPLMTQCNIKPNDNDDNDDDHEQ